MKKLSVNANSILAAAKRLARAFVVVAVCLTAFVAIHFPYATDAPLTAQQIQEIKDYYTKVYEHPTKDALESEYDTLYVRVAETSAKNAQIDPMVREFAQSYGLNEKKVLEIGSGRGYLQDIVPDYTGLDISPNVKRFYHKKFVLGSATALPFADNSFDVIWSIWVFEHVPNPEQALSEARRVTRDKGLLFLLPTWNASSLAANGYPVRPYSDFGLWGKIVKATVPLRSSVPYRALSLLPIRLVRETFASGPTRLRYHRLTPNYEHYWMPDSDAVNSIDSREATLWFTSRGDECLNCGDSVEFLPAVIIRVKKLEKSGNGTFTGLVFVRHHGKTDHERRNHWHIETRRPRCESKELRFHDMSHCAKRLCSNGIPAESAMLAATVPSKCRRHIHLQRADIAKAFGILQHGCNADSPARQTSL